MRVVASGLGLELLAQFHRAAWAQKVAKHNKIMLTRLRLPAQKVIKHKDDNLTQLSLALTLMWQFDLVM